MTSLKQPMTTAGIPADASARARKAVRYHLRFQIMPGENVERDTEALAQFCTTHGVEEVVLFYAGEEWNDGLLSPAEENLWFDIVRRAKEILNGAGIVVSLNPWATVLHVDRGRRLPPGRGLQAAVSPAGEVATAVGSFGDPAWRTYIEDQFGRFAELGFRIIWVEDDFRYHNHGPLTWGSGFEPAVLARFAAEVGYDVTREEVVTNILQPGEPHPWRTLWMKTWRELQLEAAAGMARAVANKAPGATRLGLMSSAPSVHSIEGRDWPALFAALGIDGRVAHRPHFVSYYSAPGRDRAHSIMMLEMQRQLRPARCEVAPEIENSAWTPWGKSDAEIWADMALAMFFGSDALLLNLFPMIGNPPEHHPRVGELLDCSRPALEWICERFPEPLGTCGVGLPWRQDAAERLHTIRGETLDELDATPFEPAYLLVPYGVPISSSPGSVNGLFGQLAWAFTDAEIEEMFSRGLFLDARSADILGQRGFSEEIGVRVEKWVGREEHRYSMEQFLTSETGVAPGLLFTVNLLPEIAVLEPLPGAREWTSIVTPTLERLGAGFVAFENDRGGRVVTTAMADPARLPRYDQRQIMVQRAVRFLAGDALSMALVAGSPYLLPIHFTAGNRHAVVVFNGGVDLAHPVLHLPGALDEPPQATLLAPLSEPAPAPAEISVADGETIVSVQCNVPYMAYLVLEW